MGSGNRVRRVVLLVLALVLIVGGAILGVHFYRYYHYSLPFSPQEVTRLTLCVENHPSGAPSVKALKEESLIRCVTDALNDLKVNNSYHRPPSSAPHFHLKFQLRDGSAFHLKFVQTGPEQGVLNDNAHLCDVSRLDLSGLYDALDVPETLPQGDEGPYPQLGFPGPLPEEDSAPPAAG